MDIELNKAIALLKEIFKIETIERCINRINEVYDNNPENLNYYTRQDYISETPNLVFG